jgi:hypothetical protein
MGRESSPTARRCWCRARSFTEHAHGLGDSGSGKTSLFLCPLIEQLVMSGECSVIVIDLKADSLELLATQIAAAAKGLSENAASRSRSSAFRIRPIGHVSLSIP